MEVLEVVEVSGSGGSRGGISGSGVAVTNRL